MQNNPLKQLFPWLVVGFVLLSSSLGLYLLDTLHSDRELLAEISEQLNKDLARCMDLARGKIDPSAQLDDRCKLCKLTYSSRGKLLSWKRNTMLPPIKRIQRLSSLPSDRILKTSGRYYYQVRLSWSDSIGVFLIPLAIEYPVQNEFLRPYIFLGRFDHKLTGLQKSQIRVGTPHEGAELVLHDPAGKGLIAIDQLPLRAFRHTVRYAVLILLILGGFALGVFFHLYARQRWHHRYVINLAIMAMVLLIRAMLWATNLPASYLDSELFSPSILAFHSLAPSLGEFTINVITLASLSGLVYAHLFRKSQRWYQKLMDRPLIVWPAMALALAINGAFILLFFKIFELITANSHVDIAFSNLFSASGYAFLILLDAGLLLLSFYLLGSLLLGLNVAYAKKAPKLAFWVFHILAFAAIYGWMLAQTGGPAWAGAAGLLLLFLTLFRYPGEPLLRQDLVNYVMIVIAFSLVVTAGVISGTYLRNRMQVEQIAKRVLGSQIANMVFAYEKAMASVEADLPYIGEQAESLSPNEFRDWFRINFLSRNFRGFEVGLYLFDGSGNRLDRSVDRQPTFGLKSEIPIGDRGKQISTGLYQLPNIENNYLDIYVGRYSISYGFGDTLQFVMEFVPTRLEPESLYPTLALDQAFYDDIVLVRAYDHAIYRDGVLNLKRGQSPFPLYAPEYKEASFRYFKPGDGYREYVEPIGNNKVVVVRYPVQHWFDVLSTFSFVFYFYAAAALLLIALPSGVLRALRLRKFLLPRKLQAKIRLGLMLISFLPLFAVVVLLSPFIENRYTLQAKTELSDELSRVTDLVWQDYLLLVSDPFGRISMRQGFKSKIMEWEAALRNDVNIFDQNGLRIASSQTAIYDAGITTDLMNEQALTQLRRGILSEVITKERTGSLDYLSGYRAIIGAGDKPVGYVNIPFMNRQDELEDEMLSFLAYLANIYLLVFLLINLVAVFLSDAITRPLTLLSQRMGQLSLGDRNEPLIYDSSDEIGDLVQSYNRMVDQLEESRERLVQTQRELAWKQMARQVAHEIKNPLTPMKLNIQHMLRAWREGGSKFHELFPKVTKTLLIQIDSLVRISDSFSAFAKMPEPVLARFPLGEVLSEVVELYSKEGNIEWDLDMKSGDLHVHADRDQLLRCFSNLIKNAMQAVENEGRVGIRLSSERSWARVEVSDTGPGIPHAMQGQVFEPGFSTKSTGMGLGLAIVKRIVETSHGKISLTSSPGAGSTFVIVLPLDENGDQEERGGMPALEEGV